MGEVVRLYQVRPMASRAVAVLSAVVMAVVLVAALPPTQAAADGSRLGNASSLMAAAASAGGGSAEPGQGARSGDYTTSYPFEVPAGREGRAPSVGLSYSSSGSPQGGVAAGWSLSAGGAITVDTTAGTVRGAWPDGGSAAAPRNFVSPDGHPLVVDPGLPVVAAGAVGYRAVGDNMSSRFEYLADTSLPWWWLAHHADGSTSYFGLKSQHPYSFAPLVRATELNGFENPAELKYTYTTVGRTTAVPSADQPREYLLTTIDYETQGSDEPYARVEFVYADPAFCTDAPAVPAIGSRLDYRLGFARLSGTRKLTQVKTSTRSVSGSGFDVRSEYALGYNPDTEACDGETARDRGAPYRELASVRRTVHRPAVAGQNGPGETVLPATTFTYGKAASYVRDDHYLPAVEVDDLRLPESIDTNQFLDHDADQNMIYAPGSPTHSCGHAFCPAPVQPPVSRFSQNVHSVALRLAQGQSIGESVSRSLVDIDGDGDVDMVERPGGLPKLAADDPGTGGCEIDVYLYRSGGFVKQDGSSPAASVFPPFSLRQAMADIPVKASTPADGSGELLCAGLNRSFSPDTSGGWMGDPNTPCAEHFSSSWKSMQQVRHGFLDYNHDGKPDLLAQPIASTHCPYVSTQGIPAPGASDSSQHWIGEYEAGSAIARPLPGTGDCPGGCWITKRQRYLYVYLNTGSGFASTATRVEAPMQPNDYDLERANLVIPQDGVFSAYSDRGWAEARTLGELNGDGVADLISPESHIDPTPGGLQPNDDAYSESWVNFGSATSGGWPLLTLMPDLDTELIPRRLPADFGSGKFTSHLHSGAVVDVNGDGLDDLVQFVRVPAAPGEAPSVDVGTKVRFNTGFGFATAAEDGEVMFSEYAADTNFLDSHRAPQLSAENWQKYRPTGERFGKTRMRDFDGDGLPDVLFYDRESDRAQLYAGGGRQWVSAHPADTAVTAYLAGVIEGFGTTYGGTVQEFYDRADYRYAATHQAADLNGDGLVDLLSDPDGDGQDVTVRYAKAMMGAGDTYAPARLLRTVSNGTGAKTTVHYKSDARAGKWVTSQVVVNPGHGQPEISSSHSYIKPTFVSGPYGGRVFRGYGEVHTRVDTAPGQADDLVHVTQYAYNLDPAGVVSLSATVMGHQVNATGITGDQPGVMIVRDPDYHVRELDNSLRIRGARADYPLQTVLPARMTTSKCTGVAGQTLTACRTTAPKVTEETTWDRKLVDGAYVMELPQKTEVQFVNSEGVEEVRRTTPTFNLAWSTVHFRIAPASSADSAVVDGVETALGEVRYTYKTVNFSHLGTITVDDATPGVPDRTSRFGYYLDGAKNGLLRRVWAPEQVHRHDVDTDGDPGFTEFDYDVHGVHVTRTTNPLGHTTETVVDPATGQALDVIGPNYACPDGDDPASTLDPPSACDFAQAKAAGLTERGHVDVDGLGRIVRTTAYRIGDVQQNGGVETYRATYHDRAFESDATGSTRNSVVTENRVGRTADGLTQFSHSTVEFDGLGRTLLSRVVQDDSVAREVKISYNKQGLPAEVTVPAGSGGADGFAAGTLTLVTAYDPLRRIVSTGEKLAGGVVRPWRNHSYDGLTTTVAQVVAHASDTTPDYSPEKRTTITTDALGQLSTVAELTNFGQPDAVTRYTQDPLGNTASVTDPEGVVTTLVHDYSRNRRAVTRPGPGQGRTWQYDYNRNDQLIAITEPVPAGRSAAEFTHRKEYDDLGRLTRLVPGSRDLTPAEKDEFGHGPTVLGYDVAHSSVDLSAPLATFTVGRLTSVTSPVATTITRYNEQGLPVSSSQQLNGLDDLPGLGDTLSAHMVVDDVGIPENIQYAARDADRELTFLGALVRTGFDRDGTPSQTRIELGTDTMSIAVDRNSAGLTAARRANSGPNASASFAEVHTRYDRDQYGRLTDLRTVTFDEDREELQRYRQTLGYYDNGLISRTTEQLGDIEQPEVPTDYYYDNRHMLTTASQGVDPDTETGGVGYWASLMHRPSGRIDYATVSTSFAASGRPVVARSVEYRYGAGDDPLRLGSLHADNGTENGVDLASFDYDEAGNTTNRTVTQADGTTMSYTQRWDGPSSLRKVTRQSGESETYFYHDGTRVAAVQHTSDGSVAQVRRYFGHQEVVYTPGEQPDYRQTITLGGEAVGRVDGDRETGTFEHYTTTSQGHHVLALAAEDGSTRRVASYGAFGEKLEEFIPEGTEAGKYPQEFNGKDYEPVSDLHHYGARYYDPYSLQWSSADPLYIANPDLAPLEPTSANLYTFTGNDPVNRVDPNGLDSCGAGQFCSTTSAAPMREIVFEPEIIEVAITPASDDPTDEDFGGAAEEEVEGGPGTAETIDPPIVGGGGGPPASGGGTSGAGGGSSGGGGGSTGGGGGDFGGDLVAGATVAAAVVGGAILALNKLVPWPTAVDGYNLVKSMMPGDGGVPSGVGPPPGGGAPDSPGPGDPGSPNGPGLGGVATLRWDRGHASIAVLSEATGSVVETHLTTTSDGATTTVVRFWEHHFSARATFISFKLPNAVAAQAYQVFSVAKGSGGTYRPGVNDCITYVSRVLLAGGVPVSLSGVGPGGGFAGSALQEYGRRYGTPATEPVPRIPAGAR